MILWPIMLFIMLAYLMRAYLGAAVAKWSGHWPGNHKVPGLMPGIDPWLLLCFLGQETYPYPSHLAVKPGHVVYDLCDKAQLKNSLWLMLSSLHIRRKK